MGLGKRVGRVLFAAVRGWICACMLALLFTFVVQLHKSSVYDYAFRWQDVLNGGTAFMMTCTLIVTMAVTSVLILPFFLAVQTRVLLARPWLVFVGPAVIVLPVSLLICAALRSQVDTLADMFRIYGTFAMLTCALSSAFLHSDLDRDRRDHAALV